jgi:hypothetical protein
MKKIFASIIAVIISSAVFTQAPQKMSYQAVIRNASNNLVSSHSVGMKISILKGSATGTAVYTETQTPTTNANGLVSIEFGGGAGFSSIDWSTGLYFIKTETDPTGGTNYTITGTSQLLSVPFALYANKAGNGFSGNYPDLNDKPLIFSNLYNSYNLKAKSTLSVGGNPTYGYRPDGYNLVVTNNDSVKTKQGGVLIIGNDTSQFYGNIPQVPLEIIGNIKKGKYDEGQGKTRGRLICLHREDNSEPLINNSKKYYIGISNTDNLYIGSWTEAGSVFFGYGKIGIGVNDPKSTLHLKYGGIYLESTSYDNNNGIIMKTPDGTKCYKITIDNSGNLITHLVNCP